MGPTARTGTPVIKKGRNGSITPVHPGEKGVEIERGGQRGEVGSTREGS